LKLFNKPRKYYLTIFIQELIMIIIVLVALYPIFFLLVTSFKSPAEYLTNKFSIPLQPTILNFIEAMRGGKFIRWIFNSLVITFGSVMVGIILSIFAAFPLSRMQFKGRQTITNLMIVLMVIPAVAMIVPLYIMFSRFKLIDTYQGAIIIYAAILIPFSIYLLISFFKTVPNEILESARIDGCSNFKILINIIIPLSMPSIVTLIIINSLWVWNELIIALVFLHTDSMRTVMAGLTVYQAKFGTNVTAVFAGLFISSLPLIILYIVFQRFFIRGLVSGAIKG